MTLSFPALVEACLTGISRTCATVRSYRQIALRRGRAAMPMIQVPVTVQANGVLRPSIERQEARAAESGIVLAVYAREGQHVRAGDTLLVLDGSTIATRLAASDSIAHARQDELDDLTRLLAAGDSVVAWSTLKTSYRRQQFREHAMIVVGWVPCKR